MGNSKAPPPPPTYTQRLAPGHATPAQNSQGSNRSSSSFFHQPRRCSPPLPLPPPPTPPHPQPTLDSPFGLPKAPA